MPHPAIAQRPLPARPSASRPPSLVDSESPASVLGSAANL